MAMAEIWLTAAAEEEFNRLQAAEPRSAAAVHAAIDAIPSKPGRRLDLPGANQAEPFLAEEPGVSGAPVVIYRRTTPEEAGDWLVVSLMKRDDYRAARRAEVALAATPPAFREFVDTLVAGSVASVTATALPGTVNVTQEDGGATPTAPGTSGHTG